MERSTRPTSADTFQYPPLPAGADGIRILKIEPGDFSEPLICTLTSVAFSAKPKFVALSYTWNDPYPDNARLPTSPDETKPPHRPASPALESLKPHRFGQFEEHGHDMLEELRSQQSPTDRSELESKAPKPSYNEVPTINLNYHPFHIGHNLYLALLHLRSPTVALTLWIDAVCINQADIDERNAQVAIMSFIYMRATKVIAWLGTQDYEEQSGLFRTMSAFWKAGQTQHFASTLSQGGKLRGSREPNFETFFRMTQSSYWTRLWIVQETCIPQHLVLVYGPNIWTYADLSEWPMMRDAKTKGGLWTMLDERTEAVVRLVNARDARYTDRMKLECLIEVFASSGCAQSRDKVYGLLGLANDIRPIMSTDSAVDPLAEYINSLDMQQDNLPKSQIGVGYLVVDYSRSLLDIWVSVIKFVFFQAKNIERHFSTTAQTELPWDTERIKRARSLEQHERAVSIVRTAGLVQEALGLEVEEEVASPDLLKHARIIPVIRAIGYLSGEIVQLGPHYESLVASFREQQEWTSSWGEHYHKPEDLEMLRRLNEDYTAKTMDYDKEDLDRIQEIRNPSVLAWRMERSRPKSCELERTSAWDFASGEVSSQSSGPRVSLGTNCTMAMVPLATNLGDVIVRFWNCSAAIVMRPISPTVPSMLSATSPASSFMLVGRADVSEFLERDGSPGRDERAEQRLLDVPNPSVDRFEACGAVYIDLDFQTLQIITASINSKRTLS